MGIIKGIVKAAIKIDKAKSREIDAFANSIGRSIMGDSSAVSRKKDAERRAQRNAADEAAKRRYDALDNLKKAEYDARTYAAKGKSEGYYNKKKEADYWYKESKKW